MFVSLFRRFRGGVDHLRPTAVHPAVSLNTRARDDAR
jgi:hypothetical protein